MTIRLEQLTKRYDGRPVVSNFTLEVARGTFCVLLGPSGSGKSTVLRLIAGLAAPDAGRILVDGDDLAGIPAQRRNVGFVFQSYALFRRMTVAENVEFALAVRRVGRTERRRRREELLELVGLAGFGERLPHQLSGGQQQRVALARALAHRPRLLLLDEPFGALDARIRTELRRSLAAVHRELGITTLFVTHDQEEAFELADRVAVLAHGRLVEEGPPRELYLRPTTEFVATFLGGANLFVGESTAAGVRIGPVEIPLAPEVRAEGGGRRVQVLVRPEEVALAVRRESLGAPAWGEATVEDVTFVGTNERLRLRLEELPRVRVIHPPPPFGGGYLPLEASRSQIDARREPLAAGDRVWVGIRRLHALAHPGLALLSLAGPGSAADGAAGELARLTQARLARLAAGDPAALAARLAVEPPDLVIAELPREGGAELAAELLSAGATRLLLLRGTRPLPPRRFLVAVAVGEPAKHDVAFVGRFARHLGSTATVITVLAAGADDAEEAAARRFLDAGVRTLSPLGVRGEAVVERGDLESTLAARMGDGHDLLVLGAPLPDESGRLRFRRAARALLDGPGDYPILLVRGYDARIAEEVA
jgi:sulfate transport system ATP-binding protein